MLGDWEIPQIERIEALERRGLVELPVPGRVGSLFHDTNTLPVRIAICGSLFGDDARDQFLGTVRERFKAGEPVTFVGDIITATEVQYVLIEELWFEEVGTRPDEIAYRIVLAESSPPPPPSNPLGDLDTSVLDEAGGFLDTVTGALDIVDTLGSVPDIGDPTPPLTTALSGVQSATAPLGEALGPLQAILGTEDA